jgi:hypothetical protein
MSLVLGRSPDSVRDASAFIAMNALLQFCFGCYADALVLTFSQVTEIGDDRLLCDGGR